MVLVHNPLTGTFLSRAGLPRGRCKHPAQALWFATAEEATPALTKLGGPWELVHVYLFTTPIPPEDIEQ